MEHKVIKYIRIIFDQEEEVYYKPVRVGNFWFTNYIEYESNDDRNKTFSGKEYLDEVKPYLKDIINNLKASDRCKIELTTAINFVSSKDMEEKYGMDPKCGIVEIMILGAADEVFPEILESLLCVGNINEKY